MTYKYQKKGLHFDVDTDGTLLDNLISYHSFRESVGNRVDAMGSFNMTSSNRVYSSKTSLFNGHCADFEISDSSYLISTGSNASNLTPSGTQDFSICGWFKPESSGVHMMIASQYNSPSNHRRWILAVHSTDVLWVHKADADGTYGKDVLTSDTITAGTWHFVYAYWDMDVGAGVSLDNGTIATGAHTENMKAATGDLVIGAYDSGNLRFDGLMGQWCMWHKILSAQEVTDMYNSGAANRLIGWDIPN